MSDAAAPPARESGAAGALRYWLQPAILAAAAAGLAAGGLFLWTGAAAYLLVVVLADNLIGDAPDPAGGNGRFADAALYATLPLVVLCTLLFAWHLSEGGWPTFEALALAGGFELAAARAHTGPLDLVGAVASVSTVYGAAGGIVGHELMHRLSSRADQAASRMLLAFCLDTPLAIEHVHGHHRTVATAEDPTSAPRGMGLWRHVVRSTIGGNRNAFRYEAARLARQGLAAWHWRNRALSWQLASAAIIAFFAAAAGWRGVAGFLAAAALAKLSIEIFNYLGHYGLVRVEGRPVRARHSWTCNRIISTGFAFNLPRHASHHMNAAKPFWKLAREEASPELPYGVGMMVLISLVPPLWHRAMAPRLADWDRNFASDGERALLARGT